MLVVGMVAGVGVTAAGAAPAPADASTPCTTSSTDACAASLTMTSGSYQTQSPPATNFPAQATPAIAGTYDPTTGSVTGATLTLPPVDNVCTGEGCTNFLWSEVTPGTAQGTIDYQGNVTITDALQLEVDVTSPISAQCVSSPVNVTLKSTSPYDPSVGTLALADTTYSIPDFPVTAGCISPVAAGLNAFPGGVAGATGNALTLNLAGTPLPLPPAPAAPSITTLSATPDSPQLTGTAVTLNASIAPASGTGPTATGNVAFQANGVTIGTVPVSGGIATLTTSTLASTTNQLTAIYSGDSNYSPSTSAAVPYVIQPRPSVSANLPSVVTVGAPPTPFSITVNNPAAGNNWDSLYLDLSLTGVTETVANRPTISYQDSAGNWCPLTYATTSTTTFFVYFSGAAPAPCGSNPAPVSMSLDAGATLTIPMEIAYPSGATAASQGQTMTATLSSGSCTSPTVCTASGPLSGSAAPAGRGSFLVLPTGGPYVPTVNLNTAPPVATARGLVIRSLIASAKRPASPAGLPGPSGTITYLMDGNPVASVPLDPGSSGTAQSSSVTLSTTDLATGTHTIILQYSGDSTYVPTQSVPYSFTVTPPPPGNAFLCTQIAGGTATTLPATVQALGITAPTTAPPGSTISASGLSFEIYTSQGFFGSSGTGNVPTTVGIGPDGTTSGPGIPYANDTTDGYQTAGLSGLSATVTVDGSPGDTVPLSVNEISWLHGSGALGATIDCVPADPDQPATFGSVFLTGNTLAVSPSGPAPVGAPVTLTDTVYPTPANGGQAGQVEFYDGTTDLGTAAVAFQGISQGTASLTINSLAAGDHQLSAVWSGNLSIPANTSNTVDYGVGTAPTITTQPTDQSVSPNKTATFTASASGDPTPSVQWQVSTDGGVTFTDIPGATDMSYTTPATMLIDNGNQYQAVFTNGVGGNVVTSPATLTVGFSPATTGYRLATSNGGVLAFGTDTNYGSVTGPLNAPIVGMASTPDGGGYWLVAADGGIFTFGDAGFYGSQGGKPLNAPIVGMAATPDGQGYWLVAADGGIFTFGDAGFYQSMGGMPLNAPVVGMASTPDGGGYWLVAADGGIFTFGDATFSGSASGMSSAPVVGMAATSDGGGYWLVAADGGIFTFGDATFNGSAAGQSSAPVVGMVPTSDGGGYWIGAQDGGIFTFGNAPFDGSGVGMANAPVVAITQ